MSLLANIQSESRMQENCTSAASIALAPPPRFTHTGRVLKLPGKALAAVAAGVVLLEVGGRAWMAYRRWLWTYRREPAS